MLSYTHRTSTHSCCPTQRYWKEHKKEHKLKVRYVLSFSLFTCILSACSHSNNALHQGANTNLPSDVGLHGYSPVSYFDPGVAQRGDPAYAVVYKNRRYLFTNAEQVKTFNANPERFTPRYGEYCPYSLALGRRVGIDPTNFMIHDDQLFLFHDAIELSTVDVLQQQATFDRADKEFELIRF